MSTLLSHRINTLLLNIKAPFPSETDDGHSIVRKWRLEQRLNLVRPDPDFRDRDSSDIDSVPDMGGDER